MWWKPKNGRNETVAEPSAISKPSQVLVWRAHVFLAKVISRGVGVAFFGSGGFPPHLYWAQALLTLPTEAEPISRSETALWDQLPEEWERQTDWALLRSQWDLVQVDLCFFVGSGWRITVSRSGLSTLCYAFLTWRRNKVVVKWGDSEWFCILSISITHSKSRRMVRAAYSRNWALWRAKGIVRE